MKAQILKNTILIPLLIALAAVTWLFFDGFVEMEYRWSSKDEYSHGYMIPLVALFMFWQKLPELRQMDWTPSRWSVVVMVAALCGLILGSLSALFIIVHYSFLLVLFALGLACYGWKGFRLTWAALVYLVFMIPLPPFLYNQLSAVLQLISTKLGVLVVRAFDISVFVSGNVIDLGSYQLQVAEACSGLRYLFPLMSFGFLIAVLYKGPRWHQWLIFLSTIPITVLMNSFRIGVIGVTVEYWGIEMAEGFLHDFEGWFVFMACLGVLAVEIWIINLFSRDKVGVLGRVNLYYPVWREIAAVRPGLRNTGATVLTAVILLLVAIPVNLMMDRREEVIPPREQFSNFPLLYKEWIGRETVLEEKILESLDYPDYIVVDYQSSSWPVPVNLYVAYYKSQRAGAAIHSPRSCVPGDGWLITDLSQKSLDALLGSQGIRVNRVIIEKNATRQLVYYWFQQRGRVITNEYLAKWYLFWDSLTMSRTDGALVRVVIPVSEEIGLDKAEEQLQQFVKDFYPILPEYLPGGT